jgi:predicted amidohydrolase YtcJ
MLLVTALFAHPAQARDADAIWFGGPIITVDPSLPSAEAVAVKDGRIVAVGRKAAIMQAEQGSATVLNDLAGRTLIPGFFDAHGHFSAVGVQALSANLLPPPDGSARSIPEIQAIMRDYIASSPVVKQYNIAIGFNYDDSQLAEKRAPTRTELDAISTEIPIMLTHQSGHLGAYNSKALAMAGVTADSPNPEGGVIQREADGRTPNGVLEENAHNAALGKLFPKLTPQDAMRIISAAQAIYAANGYTTVQEGRADPGTMALLAGAARAGKLELDIVAYPDLVANATNPVLTGPLMARTYTDHLRIGGVKLTFDGSPQGKTAWFTKPYFHVPEGQKPGYNGYPSFPKPGEAAAWVDKAYKNNWQLMIHANGDAAIDEMLTTVAAAAKDNPGTDRRTVMIHGQYLRPDQIEPLQKLGIFPALFPMHTFYWGDWHRDSVAGPDRAAFISPTASVLKTGMKFSIHHDAPVTFPNSMRVLDSAVNRTTRSGRVLGPDQRISPMVALQAMTLWPAYQHFEEASKGSISVGKIADLVVLDRNPLKIEPATIKDIKVMQTIKAGKSVYTRPL